MLRFFQVKRHKRSRSTLVPLMFPHAQTDKIWWSPTKLFACLRWPHWDGPSILNFCHACVHEAECACLHILVSYRAYNSMQILCTVCRKGLWTQNNVWAFAAKHAQERCVRGLSCWAELTLDLDMQVKRRGLHSWLWNRRVAKMCPFQLLLYISFALSAVTASVPVRVFVSVSVAQRECLNMRAPLHI